MFFPKQYASLRTSMYLLIWHLKTTKKFLCLVHALWKNVSFWKQTTKNRQHFVEAISTNATLRLEAQYACNSIELRNIGMLVKWFLCRRQHVVILLCR